jgi:hypothetical protein
MNSWELGADKKEYILITWRSEKKNSPKISPRTKTIMFVS